MVDSHRPSKNVRRTMVTCVGDSLGSRDNRFVYG